MFRALSTLPLMLLLVACDAAGPNLAPPPPRIWPQTTFDLPLPTLPPDAPPPGRNSPKRIVSLTPSATEMIAVLGFEDRLVGRSHWCDVPASVQNLPDLGGLADFQAERIADLKPDLVVLFDMLPELKKLLTEDFGIKCCAHRAERDDDLFDGLRAVARALDAEARGEWLIRHIQSGLSDLSQRMRSEAPPRVLVILDRHPPFAACPGSFVDLLLRAAGGVNAVTNPPLDRPWCQLHAEALFDLEPDVILDLSIGENAQASISAGADFWSRFSEVPAVQNGRVHMLEAPVLVRPGPRLLGAAELLARIIASR